MLSWCWNCEYYAYYYVKTRIRLSDSSRSFKDTFESQIATIDRCFCWNSYISTNQHFISARCQKT